MHFLTFTTLFATLSAIRVAAQGIVVSQPVAGATFAAGSITVVVADSGDAPTLSTLKTGTVDLVWGGNTAANSKYQAGIGTFNFPTVTTLTLSIPPGVGPEITNGYYFRITSAATDGGSVINYSGRYTITGMKGTADATLTSAAAAAGAAVPAAQVQAAAAGGAAAGAAGGQFNVPYGQQSGLTKYAPMQPVPPTKITKQDYTPLNPTSAFNIAVTFLPRPSILTTVTQPQTFSVVSIENTAAPQSNPNSAMQKFLNRWKD